MREAKIIWPLNTEAKIFPDYPGTFSAIRMYDIHTGIDLYCKPGTEVIAMEPGIVVGIEAFTGEHVPGEHKSAWWNNTFVVLIHGNITNQIFAYGEISSFYKNIKLDAYVEQGTPIGRIDVPVLKNKKQRPITMLHMEQYSELPYGYTGSFFNIGDISATAYWPLNAEKPMALMDPTNTLLNLSNEEFCLNKYKDGFYDLD